MTSAAAEAIVAVAPWEAWVSVAEQKLKRLIDDDDNVSIVELRPVWYKEDFIPRPSTTTTKLSVGGKSCLQVVMDLQGGGSSSTKVNQAALKAAWRARTTREFQYEEETGKWRICNACWGVPSNTAILVPRGSPPIKDADALCALIASKMSRQCYETVTLFFLLE